MNLIYFQGLNCYHVCVISLANHFGINYPDAFATLWSETDFRYDSYHQVYLTKRMLTNLEALGARVEALACPAPEDADRALSLFQEGEFMIVGMDAFYIPWDPFYQTFHGPHYFITQYAKTDRFLCFDPTYNKKNEQIDCQEITMHTFEICRMTKAAQKSLKTEAIHEAQEILHTHPNTHSVLLSQIHDCIGGERKNMILLAKYIDAMINNRYLYRFFLEDQPLPYDENHLLLKDNFFLEWKAVKNGLYKASIKKNNEDIIHDVSDRFSHLIEKEITMSERIISGI